MARSDLASEAIWRPKQPPKIYLKKIRMLSQSSSVNEFQEVAKMALRNPSHCKSKISPPPNSPTAGILGPDLVVTCFNKNRYKLFQITVEKSHFLYYFCSIFS